ncbi:class II aldolase/adducin family protein [Actinomadura sp. SCN-SB]|uniref:class II aldolase/adducin family protein n=1 Tax=Actinomadura sp. SCN-SB TaxID=3373092 RepID=UPI0037528512
MRVDDPRFKIAAARRMLYREGCDSGVAGHVSARAPGADAFWITPFEYFDETTPDRVIKLSFDLEVLEGDWEASPAVQFHAAIYRERPDVGSIVHTHSHYAAVVTTTGRPVGMYNEVSTLFHNEQAWYADDGVQPQVEGKRMAAALGDKRVLHMRNHGILIAAPDLEEATVDAMTLEKAAKIHLDAVAAGGQEIPLPQVMQAKSLYEQYFRRNTWAAQLRRLRVSDPDLFAWLDEGDAERTA